MIVNSQQSLDGAIERLIAEYSKHKYLVLDVKTGKSRTGQQNRALHTYFELVADALNDAGITFEQFFKDGFDLPWSKYIVKDELWRPVQKALYDTESTRNLNREHIDKVYDYINNKLASYGLHVPFPAEDNK